MSVTTRKPRAMVHVYGDHTVKRFVYPDDYERELKAYRRLSTWACPVLHEAHYASLTLRMDTHPVAYQGAVRPANVEVLADRLYELLVRLHQEHGVHHRDVHPRNIVLRDGEWPLLIDWETALFPEDGPGALSPSYDLYGPEVSHIAPPPIHRAIRSKRSPNGYSMWVAADHPMSVKNQWQVDFN